MKKIKEWASNNSFKIVFAIFILSAFYWFQLRPSFIKKECWGKIEKMQRGEFITDGKFERDVIYQLRIKNGMQETIDEVYGNCLRKKGL